MKKIFCILLSLMALSCVSKNGYETLPAWQEGMLDIHCISTGMGNATYIIMPDGTTLLVDAGDLSHNKLHRAPHIPDDSKSAGAWIADYIGAFHPQGKACELDYAFITHFHDDHIGGKAEGRKVYEPGGYTLSGITEVGTLIPIRKLLDRGYSFPVDIDTCNSKAIVKLRNQIDFYRNFITYQKGNGMQYETVIPGSSEQVRMLNEPQEYPDFSIRILFSAGRIAVSEGTGIARERYASGEYPGENELSAGFRMSYGPFKFYTGGDISGIGPTGAMYDDSMESCVADLIGPVDVAILNHHGDRNSQNERFVASLSPRVWIGFGWGVRHPGQETLGRISSKGIYPGERDIYTTWMSPHCEAYLCNSLGSYKSLHGHVVVRVRPGGDSYDIYVLDDSDTTRKVLQCNHYETR